MAKPSAPIPRLLEFLRVVHRMERGKAFSAAMGIDYPHFERLAAAAAAAGLGGEDGGPGMDGPPPRRPLHYDATARTLSARVDLRPLRLDLGFRPGNKPTSGAGVPLSVFQAVIDDLTTWALVLADPTRGRAGASVTLQSAWAPPVLAGPVPSHAPAEGPRAVVEEVTVRATADKVGKNLGFASAEIRTPDGDLVCVGSQVKYLPMGPLMDFLQSSRGWRLTKLYTEYGIALPEKENAVAPSLESLFAGSLHYSGDGDAGNRRAAFAVTPAHASLAGAIHGGCQSVLMEAVARDCLERRFPQHARAAWTLQSMSVDYLSPPSPRMVELVPEVLVSAGSDGGEGGSVPVRVSLESGGRKHSRGLLLFRAEEAASPDLSRTSLPLSRL